MFLLIRKKIIRRYARRKVVLAVVIIGGSLLVTFYWAGVNFLNEDKEKSTEGTPNSTDGSVPPKSISVVVDSFSDLSPVIVTMSTGLQTQELQTSNDSDFSFYNSEDVGEIEYDPLQTFWNNSNNDVPFLNNLFYFSCQSTKPKRVKKRNRQLVVYENFLIAAFNVQCHESITYSTHGDYRYLDNLIPLVDRWNGPVSVALYAPGSDLNRTMKAIRFLRDCGTNRVKNFVTFHVFFDVAFAEPSLSQSTDFHNLDSIYDSETAECDPNFFKNMQHEETFKMKQRILYPVNVARNIARSASMTHFVLASDIELYPSIDFIASFFKMLSRGYTDTTNPVIIPARKLYVLPVFEVKVGIPPPETKSELMELLRTGDAITFHSNICKECHLIPQYEDWMSISDNPDMLRVFHTAKRKYPYQYWEPIYVGTMYEPLYDERLSWEGQRDKMTQGFILCALDYDFLILDNAFLVHKPGIKQRTNVVTKANVINRQNRLIDVKIKAEMFRRFGRQNDCAL